MALYLTEPLDDPNVLYSNVGVRQVLLRARKVTFVLAQILSPGSERMGRAHGLSDSCSFVLSAGIWPTFSLWTFPPPCCVKLQWSREPAARLCNHPSWCTPFSLWAYSCPWHTECHLFRAASVFLGDKSTLLRCHLILSTSAAWGSGHCSGAASALLTSCPVPAFPSPDSHSSASLFTVPFCVCRAQGNPSPFQESMQCQDRLGWQTEPEPAGALPPLGTSASLHCSFFKTTLQEISLGKNLATPV